MFYGPPGTGKTSFIKAICLEVERDAKIMDMRGIKTASAFKNIFEKYEQYVYVLDEFDCVQGVLERKSESCTIQDERKNIEKDIMTLYQSVGIATNADSRIQLSKEIDALKEKITNLENQLTLDTLLTVLDGMHEMRGRIIIATTNQIDAIDSALMRPGRFDLKLHLGNFNQEETRQLLTRYYQVEEKEDLAYLQSKNLKDEVFTPVQLIHMFQQQPNFHSMVDQLSVTSNDVIKQS
jgi:chaperone BCS1